MALNDKEECFATEYIINKGNAYQAALSAGYKPKTAQHAYEWLNETLLNPTSKRHLPYKPELRKYIDEQIKKVESDKIVTAEEVMEYLTSVLRGESESEVVVVEGRGMGVSEAKLIKKKPDEKERIQAAREMAKILGISKEKLDITASQVMIVDDVPEDW